MVYLKSVENVITLGRLKGLLFLFCLPLLYFVFENTYNKRNDLARPVMPVMGTVFLVSMNKSQELTVFHGRQKLISAKN